MQINNGLSALLSQSLGPRTSSPNAPAASANAPAAAGPRGVSSYDFTHMTPRQMQSTMNDLIRRGELSFDDSTGLVSMIPTALSSIDANGQTPPAYDAPMDFIASMQTAIASALSRGESGNAANLTKTLEALRRLQGTASSVDLIA